MMELLFEVLIKGAQVMPSLLKDVTGTVAKIEADTAMASRVKDALAGLASALEDILKIL